MVKRLNMTNYIYLGGELATPAENASTILRLAARQGLPVLTGALFLTMYQKLSSATFSFF